MSYIDNLNTLESVHAAIVAARQDLALGTARLNDGKNRLAAALSENAAGLAQIDADIAASIATNDPALVAAAQNSGVAKASELNELAALQATIDAKLAAQ